MSDDETDYGLVMPFVTTQDGGPHEAASYVAGFEMGALDAQLAHLAVSNMALATFTSGCHAENRPQADLIAMNHGFTIEFEALAEGWLNITLKRSGGVE